MSQPYGLTPVLDDAGNPAAPRRDHSTMAEVWDIIRILERRLLVQYEGEPERMLNAGEAALVRPLQKHRVGPVGAVRMRVEFYCAEPEDF